MAGERFDKPQPMNATWAMPVAIVAIALAAVAGFALPLLVDKHPVIESDMRIIAPAIFTLVLAGGMLHVRYLLIPRLLSMRPPFDSSDDPRQIQSAAIVLAAGIPVVDAASSVFVPILTNQSLWALWFGLLGIIAVAVNIPYTRSRFDEFYRERAMRGTS